MRARVVIAVLACFTALAAPAAPSEPDERTPGAHDLDGIDATRKAAYEACDYAYCRAPSQPLGPRQRKVCALAPEIDGCDGLEKACGDPPPEKKPGWLESHVASLASIGKFLLYALVFGSILALAVPVVLALRKLRRDRRLVAQAKPAEARATVVEVQRTPEHELNDAEAVLGLAAAHRTRGELGRALSLYLAASLVALDRRGALRLARYRTNGEYVRACEEREAKPSLREIVREVDAVEFGGALPSEQAVDRVAAKARAIVCATTAALPLMGILGAACTPAAPGSDPAGDDLPIATLQRNLFRVGRLGSSLATVPIPDEDEGAPVVIVDVERVPLEAEARAHMMRWVEADGTLVLFGHVSAWPSELRARGDAAETRDLVVRTPDPKGGLEGMDTDDDIEESGAPVVVEGARTARRDALAWDGAEPIAFLGEQMYAAKKRVGQGVVVGVANDDLFTNVGAMPRRNPAALVTLVRAASHDPVRLMTTGGLPAFADVRVARAEDGIAPPSNPFAALVAAGLGKGAWHALAAAALLFLAYGIRHARPPREEKRTRRAFAEHVRATGALYARARVHAHALAAYGDSSRCGSASSSRAAPAPRPSSRHAPGSRPSAQPSSTRARRPRRPAIRCAATRSRPSRSSGECWSRFRANAAEPSVRTSRTEAGLPPTGRRGPGDPPTQCTVAQQRAQLATPRHRSPPRRRATGSRYGRDVDRVLRIALHGLACPPPWPAPPPRPRPRRRSGKTCKR
jgi:hypothetical protein